MLQPYDIVKHPEFGLGTVPELWEELRKQPEFKNKAFIPVEFWEEPAELELPQDKSKYSATYIMVPVTDLVSVPFSDIPANSVIVLNSGIKYFVFSKNEIQYDFEMVDASRTAMAYHTVALTGDKVGEKFTLILEMMRPTKLSTDEYLDLYNAFKALPNSVYILSSEEQKIVLQATIPN